MLSTVLAFPEVWIIVSFLRRRPLVFPTDWCHNELTPIWCIVWQQTFYHYHCVFFLFYWLFFLLMSKSRWPTNTSSVSLRSFDITKKENYIKPKQISVSQSTLQHYWFGGQQDRKFGWKWIRGRQYSLKSEWNNIEG